MMQLRQGLCYPKICRKREDEMVISKEKRRRRKDLCEGGVENLRRKKMRPAPESAGRLDFFDGLPDDLVVCILCKLSSSAGSPSDFTNVLITCKRLNGLGLHPLVLGKVSPKALAVRAKKWSESSHRFLKLRTEAGNIEACFMVSDTADRLLNHSQGSKTYLLSATMMEEVGLHMHFPIQNVKKSLFHDGFHVLLDHVRAPTGIAQHSSPEIMVCSNHMNIQDEVNQVVIHELIHAYDDCRAANLDWANCAHHASSEVCSRWFLSHIQTPLPKPDKATKPTWVCSFPKYVGHKAATRRKMALAL